MSEKISTEIASNARSWPFEEARKLLKRNMRNNYVLFETGYGPSGLPHIGTFGEVLRTSFVKHAFECLSDIPTRLFVFSDDMDGLRKIPDTVPNPEKMKEFLNLPLTKIPDPWGCHESYGHHNNAKLMSFLNSFNLKYEFQSSTEWYKSGRFNDGIKKVLEHHEKILEIMLPSLREERASTYSPFLPISPKTGKVLQVQIQEYNLNSNTIVFEDDDGTLTELSVFNGNCKLQWKVDWALRWFVLGVDYEMAGKDLIDSVKLSSKICSVLGSSPPESFNYELFLDEENKKISKSKGNGLTIEEWLKYAPLESLSYYMFLSPKSAKRLYFDVIPRSVDDYLNSLDNFLTQTKQQQADNPAWHIHESEPPLRESGLNFNLLLNLASVCNAEDPKILWGFITRYSKEASPEKMPYLNQLVNCAITYYHDFIKPKKHYRAPSELEISAFNDLKKRLLEINSCSAEEIQQQLYEVGKSHDFKELKQWFKALYEVLLGQNEGPRMGSFIALYGINETIALINEAIQRK